MIENYFGPYTALDIPDFKEITNSTFVLISNNIRRAVIATRLSLYTLV